MVPDDLEQQIEKTRITYPEREHGFTIRGAPFSCDFDATVDPESFCDTVTTPDEPWEMFGISMQLADEYWKVVGTLFHVEDGDVADASKITFEVAPEWVRVYVKNDCSVERAAAFVRALDAEYGITVQFPHNEKQETPTSSTERNQ